MSAVRFLGKNYLRTIATIGFVVISAFVVGCGPAQGTPAPTATEDLKAEQNLSSGNVIEPSVESYPAPSDTRESGQVDQGYPPAVTRQPTTEAYPALSDAPQGTLLALDTPISPDDAIVSGVGPPGLFVQILNVTFMGEQLGSGFIEDDGTFAIEVSQLQPGIRIGLTADLVGSSISEEDIRPGENAISLPQVGYFYDSFVINEE